MWLALSAQRIGAEEARSIGLINKVVPRRATLTSARELAHGLLACAPLALEATKQVLLQSANEPRLEAAMQAHYPAVERMLASEDAREGPRSFAEKRKPQWKGR
jgi:enoyl-CoA hydratase/carnithine racemase